VPLELANAILDAATYWPRVTTVHNELLAVSASFVVKKSAAAYYLITSPVPRVSRDSAMLPTKVRMVKFTLKSCDQGWGGQSKYRGTYNKSGTWLEASILRNLESVESLLGLKTVKAAHLDQQCQNVEIQNPIDGTRRWHLQSNLHASSEVKRHEVVWTDMDVFDEQAEIDATAQGRGTGRGFVSTISPGDRVGVIARTLNPLWHNHVFSAQVDIFYSI